MCDPVSMLVGDWQTSQDREEGDVFGKIGKKIRIRHGPTLYGVRERMLGFIPALYDKSCITIQSGGRKGAFCLWSCLLYSTDGREKWEVPVGILGL